jgi:hypothetical protein
MRKLFRAKNVFFALIALIVGYIAEFAYRTNNICGPGEQILKSDADAIEQAQIRLFRAHYGSHGIPGYIDEKLGFVDFSRANCCTVTRTRTTFGVIIWKVDLHGETIGEPKKRNVSASMWLSNCGAVFDEYSSITAEPAR